MELREAPAEEKEVKMINSDIQCLILFLCIIAVGIVIVAWLSYLISVYITEANIIKIWRGKEIIYEGKEAFVDIKSGGITTTVTIYKQLFPVYKKDRTYSDTNIRIEGVR